MKEYFPSPQEVVSHVQESLESGRWNWSNMPAAERGDVESEDSEVLDSVVPNPEDDLNSTEAELTEITPEDLISQAEQIFSDFQKRRNLEDVATEAHLEIPQFHRLISLEHSSAGVSQRGDTTWYGITTDWKLYRYQYLPSINTITVCENVPTLRLQELTMSIALKSGQSVSFRYGENLEEKQSKLLSQGFNIPEEAARFLLLNMPSSESISSFPVKQPQFQW